MTTADFTVPSVEEDDAEDLATSLQERLVALIDLELTLKHIHWNVVGPSFIGVHEMLDPQVDAVRAMADETAERIATLGGEPIGLPGYISEHRSWDDYSLRRDNVNAHLAALDLVYNGVIADHRSVIDSSEESDPVTQDMLIGQSAQLELFQWFVRAHLENSSGQLRHAGATTEKKAADKATS